MIKSAIRLLVALSAMSLMSCEIEVRSKHSDASHLQLWLLATQRCDGSWPSCTSYSDAGFELPSTAGLPEGDPTAQVGTTSLAILALLSGHRPLTDAVSNAVVSGEHFLVRNRGNSHSYSRDSGIWEGVFHGLATIARLVIRDHTLTDFQDDLTSDYQYLLEWCSRLSHHSSNTDELVHTTAVAVYLRTMLLRRGLSVSAEDDKALQEILSYCTDYLTHPHGKNAWSRDARYGGPRAWRHPHYEQLSSAEDYPWLSLHFFQYLGGFSLPWDPQQLRGEALHEPKAPLATSLFANELLYCLLLLEPNSLLPKSVLHCHCHRILAFCAAHRTAIHVRDHEYQVIAGREFWSEYLFGVVGYESALLLLLNHCAQ